jgi:nucleoside-diphosphate-sugar epimerase
MYSIKSHFEGSTVFLTGATGYIGGLVLEKLLRTTGVKRIYVLLRHKRGQDGSSRLQKLLQTNPIFHLVRDDAVLLSLVIPVAGDVLQPGLGLSERDQETLHDEVDTIIHCAADIRLEAPIQETLRANFKGSERVLELACCVQNLSSFVYVSTAYTNINQPEGAIVKEHIYPLSFGDQPVDALQLAQVQPSSMLLAGLLHFLGCLDRPSCVACRCVLPYLAVPASRPHLERTVQGEVTVVAMLL